ncbi:MAG: ubiquinol oxidase subunit II [Pseudomonadota bacterium]
MKRLRLIFLMALTTLLSGCNLVVLNPSGDVATQQGQLIIYATVLMLIVVVPVILLTLFFAYRYRASNKDATYEPDWDHSISLEIVIWSVPLAIIICLAGLTWVATHRLNPYDDLRRISETQPIDPNVEPMTVQVVAMDWKWVFIYPEYNIATVNEVATIVDRPVEWKLTSDTVMNSFYIPAMSGMIYAMAGMETELNAVLNEFGTYEGFSANYSGAGFNHMRFDVHAFDEVGFADWVAEVRTAKDEFDRTAYAQLAQPSVDNPVAYYGAVEDDLWDRILNMCVREDELCQNDMMMVDALGGGGLEGLYNRELFRGICSADDPWVIMALVRPDLRDRGEEILAAADLLPPEQSSAAPRTVAN